MLSIFKKRTENTANQGPLYVPVKQALEDIRPYARSHGGDIELVAVSQDGSVEIRFRGACVGCPMSTVTLKLGIEQQLRQLVPGVTRVVAA